MERLFWLSAVILSVSLSPTFAQSSFDVATIKPFVGEAGKIGIFPLPGGGVQMSGATLRDMIAFAYDVPESDISGGPKWITSQRFDVMAKNDTNEAPEQGFAAFDKLRVRVQGLLAERFALRLRQESKTVPVYLLKVAEGGPRLKPTPPESTGPGRTMRSRSQIDAARAPLTALCKLLTNWLERPVLDQTGLTGMYDYVLKYAPNSVGTPLPPMPGDTVADDEGPSLFVALQEQLGLKLEAARGPVPIIVVVSAEAPTDN